MKNCLAALVICLFAGTFASPASAATVFIEGGKCAKWNNSTRFYYKCDLGTMPYGTGYNAVVPMFYTSPNHTVWCQLDIHNQYGDLIAIPTPSGYRNWADVVFWEGLPRTSVALFYQWTRDAYANMRGSFFCQEERTTAHPYPEFQIGGIYTLRQ